MVRCVLVFSVRDIGQWSGQIIVLCAAEVFCGAACSWVVLARSGVFASCAGWFLVPWFGSGVPHPQQAENLQHGGKSPARCLDSPICVCS
jgi:hypothetical protein